jgi:hypothetical protein
VKAKEIKRKEPEARITLWVIRRGIKVKSMALQIGLLAVIPFLATASVTPGTVALKVVLNEIMYHAPDDLDELQFVELHNPSDQAVDLSGWQLAKAVKFTFPPQSSLKAGGYVVVCKDAAEFKKHYRLDPIGVFTGKLSHRGEQLDLLKPDGQVVDSITYGSRSPWPVAPDGHGPSLERCCPTSPHAGPSQWAPSPFANRPATPGGSPGKQNAGYSPHPVPAISIVAITPSSVAPLQEVTVKAEIRAEHDPQTVELRYRVVSSNHESAEQSLPMRKDGEWYTAVIPGQAKDKIIRFHVRTADAAGHETRFPHPNELRPAQSVWVHEQNSASKVPLGFIFNIGRDEFRRGQRDIPRMYNAPPQPDPPARGNSAFGFIDPSGESQLFDFINVIPRTGGRKIHFHKDHTLRGMTTINLVYEYVDRFILTEPLAYEVYRQAGNAAPRTDFVRSWVDGNALGFQLLIEQPNRAFLRHNQLNPDGNFYKCVWVGRDLVTRHEKKTNRHSGHADLIDLDKQLRSTAGDAQWAFIQKHFDVDQMATFYAVHMLLSDWDGFFNNHFLYHDPGSGKWTMYPWDQDKTWGLHDGIDGYNVFTDMPLTTGMTGDRPPKGFAGFRNNWWRPAGHFSGPLLANPQFRQRFLTRTKELLEKVYTVEAFFPVIKALGDRLEEEVKWRAKARNEDPQQALDHFHKNLDALRDHLRKRRAFLLEQDELKNLRTP